MWAGGVTYRRSATARVEESSVGDVYELVYEAQRPELFLKAPAARVRAPGAPLRIRADSTWDVPEPELALVLDAHGEIVGYLAADDVSSRSIEGANPLYLPQAKIYDDSLGLSGTIVLAARRRRPALGGDRARDPPRRRAHLRRRDVGQRDEAQLRRARGRALPRALVPAGAVLLTGTGVVPPDELTLQDGDRVRIAVEGVGRARARHLPQQRIGSRACHYR